MYQSILVDFKRIFQGSERANCKTFQQHSRKMNLRNKHSQL